MAFTGDTVDAALGRKDLTQDYTPLSVPAGTGNDIAGLVQKFLPALAMGTAAALTSPIKSNPLIAGRAILGALSGYAAAQPKPVSQKDLYYQERLQMSQLARQQMAKELEAEQTIAVGIQDPTERARYIAAKREDKEAVLADNEWKLNVAHMKSGTLPIDPGYVDAIGMLGPKEGSAAYGKLLEMQLKLDNPRLLKDPRAAKAAELDEKRKFNETVGQRLIAQSEELKKTDPARAAEMYAQGMAMSTGAGMIPGLTRETGPEKVDTASKIAEKRAELQRQRDDAQNRAREAAGAARAAEARALQTQKAQDRLLADRAKSEATAAQREADTAHKSLLEAQKEEGREKRQTERQQDRAALARQARADREHLARLGQQYKLAEHKMRNAQVPPSERAKLAQQQSKYRSDAMQKHYDMFLKNRTPQERLTSEAPSMEQWLQSAGGQASARIVDENFPKQHAPRMIVSPDGVEHQLLPGYPVPAGWSLKE